MVMTVAGVVSNRRKNRPLAPNGISLTSFVSLLRSSAQCTSLGLGAMQLTTGAKRLGWMEKDLTEDEETNKQVLVIWVITLIATASVVSGLSVGIKLLSQIGFALGMVLLFLCLVMEKSEKLASCTLGNNVSRFSHLFIFYSRLHFQPHRSNNRNV